MSTVVQAAPAKAGTGKKHGALYYAMPWNLRREINILGYGFSVRRIALIYAAIIAVMVGVGLAFKLTLPWMAPLVIAGLWFAPTLVRNNYKNKFELQRFSDVNVYIEQSLYAFKNSQKILTTLEDVKILFADGAMREAIDAAIDVITDPTAAGHHENAEAKALGIIEARYPNDYVRSLHRFMLKVESIGGTFDSSIGLLLENRSMWENRVYKLQDRRKQKRSQILGSVIASLSLCLLMLYILPAEVDISHMLPVQIANVVMIVVFVRIYLAADTKLSSDLLRSQTYSDDEKLLRDYNRFVNYDAHREMRKSLVWALFPLAILAVGVFLVHNTWVIVAGVVLLPLMLFQHALGHKLLEKRLKREIGWAFPQWLMELALLLQSDNVQVAIFKTIATAPAVLRPELVLLRDKLQADPASSEPFLNFFSLFHMPEVTTSMQMLYSLSVGSGGDPDEQISNIVKRNNIILDRAEDMRNDDSMSSLYTLFLLPVLLGGMVLMVDMTMFLMSFISNIGI